jgi:protein-S-isoprenylcysteine O-methyltransferase Ste14
MTALHWLIGTILAFEMPVPLYWLVLHGPVEFWRSRKHVRIAYLFAVVVAWGGGGWLLHHFRQPLFLAAYTRGAPPVWALVLGLALIGLDMWTLTRVELALGARRLVGQAELTRSGELNTSGLYRHVRHPRYMGMIAAVLGGCLLVNSRPLWIVAAFWLALALLSISLEERELRRRFGAAYEAYAQRVPALLPFRLR